MSTVEESGIGLSRIMLICCTSLASTASIISGSLLVFIGWQLGESLKEKIVMSAFGILAVCGAHLLPALCRHASFALRLLGTFLWLCCVMFVMWGHSNFFMSSQQQAGLRRVASLGEPLLLSSPTRKSFEILSDISNVKTELAEKSQVKCNKGCPTLKVRLINLSSRLEELNAELDEYSRWQLRLDRQDSLKDSLRDDPLTSRASALLNVTVAQMGLLASLLFSCVLEGLACLCWYRVFQYHYLSVTKQVRSVKSDPSSSISLDPILKVKSEVKFVVEVERIHKEVRAKRLKLTVGNVRKYLSCAQSTAAEIKRLVLEKMDLETQVG